MYECHITIELPDSVFITLLEKKILENGWKFSKIDGDPIFGKGIKCYATQHFNSSKNVNKVLEEMNNVAEHLDILGFNVIREKIELIIYDTKNKEKTNERS